MHPRDRHPSAQSYQPGLQAQAPPHPPPAIGAADGADRAPDAPIDANAEISRTVS